LGNVVRTGRKETRELIRQIVAAGGTVKCKKGKGRRYKVYLDGKLVGCLAVTPSDHRSHKNSIAMLRRSGLQITTKGRFCETAAS